MKANSYDMNITEFTQSRKRGPLFEELDGTLPEGWTIQYHRRLTGQVDRFWHTRTKKKLRSRIDVEIFLKYLRRNPFNEDVAYDLLRKEKRKSYKINQ